MESKKVIGVVQVLQDLKDGLTREDIAKKYGITNAECKLLFQDERLKGKKTIKKPSFILVEDADISPDVVETEEVKDVAVEPKEPINGDDKKSPEEENNVEAKDNVVPEAAKATWGD